MVLTQKISRQVNDVVTLKKTGDILDIGVLAYLLLNDVTAGEVDDYKTVLSCRDKDSIFEGP